MEDSCMQSDVENAMTAMPSSSQENSVGEVTDTAGDRIRILYLYSGPPRPDDGLGLYAKELGADCTYVDKEFDQKHDLLDQTFWEDLKKDFGNYDSTLLSPPCSSFTPARSGRGGPGPLRGVAGKDRYGLKGLAPSDKKKVTEGTVLAVRAADTAEWFDDEDRWWIMEQPHEREGKPSMWKLDEMKRLRDRDGVRMYTFAQCRYGCKAEKLTDLMSNMLDLEEFTLLCNHPSQTWVIPWSGERIWAPHPPLRGKQWAIPENQWDPSMLRPCEPDGDYITRSCAAYPAELNKALAKALCRRRKQEQPTTLTPTSGAKQNLELTKIRKLMPLRGHEAEPNEPSDRNSLRDVHNWVTTKAKFIGVQVKNLIYRMFDGNQDIEKDILESLGHKSNEDILDAEWMNRLRCEVAELLVRNRAADMPASCDVSSTESENYQTTIRGKLMHYWTMVVQDPGERCAHWTYDGAPAGLELDTEELDGMFQQVESEDAEPMDLLAADYEQFQNYEGVEGDDDAFNTLEGYYEKGFLRKFNTLQDVKDYVGGDPTLSKLGCIKKSKLNLDTGEMTYKTRIILDCKRSNVSKVARRHSAGGRCDGCAKERKYFVAKLRGHYYVFTRTAQGSRGAPLTFAAILSIASRWVASAEHTMKLQVYVDDPLAIIRGNPMEQQRTACLVIVMWSIMGFPIATHKAVLAQSLVWIGVRISVEPKQVIAEVPESKVAELDLLLSEALRSNVISKKNLRTLIGKAMAIASVLFVWRPFISELYVALHAEQSHAPNGCVWTKQITHSVQWLRTFLAGEKAGIVRAYSLDVFNNMGPEIVITWDASPWGMGGTLQIQGTFAEFFAIPISEEDQIHLSTKAGTHEGQQTWEALCGLICLRLWQKTWQSSRVKLRLRSDNVGALTLFAQVKGKSSAHSLLAREFALDLGQAQYRPAIAEHLPGVTNAICDVLSRRFQPGVKFDLPIQLKKARAVVPPARHKSWWKTLSWMERTGALQPSHVDASDLSPVEMRGALQELVNDMYASSSRAPRDALLKTWTKFHYKWFDQSTEVLPITEEKLLKISSLFKKGGYKSVKNYLSRIKEHHVTSGFDWNERLDIVSRKCSRSVLRGLGGAHRSEAFDLQAVSEGLTFSEDALVPKGPVNPLALIVTSTFFMLREVEASSLETKDVTFSGDAVSIRLPVSKVDWQARGCTRTWHCLCDKGLPCVMHILKEHVQFLGREFGGREASLFPTTDGQICTKQSVVDTIRKAIDLTGGSSKDASGNWRVSGHTFRITGARVLCKFGLDPITIQLIGRWGSSAVLTYLAEAPLDGFHHRMGTSLDHRVQPDVPLEHLKLQSELDSRAEVYNLISEHNMLMEETTRLRSQISTIARHCEDTEHRSFSCAASLKRKLQPCSPRRIDEQRTCPRETALTPRNHMGRTRAPFAHSVLLSLLKVLLQLLTVCCPPEKSRQSDRTWWRKPSQNQSTAECGIFFRAYPRAFSRFSLVHFGAMFGIAAAKANFSEVITEQLGSWRPWLVFLLGIFGILSHMQVFVLAWGTTFYVVPLYLMLHICLATWVSNLTFLQLLESPLWWFFPPGTSHLLEVQQPKVQCFRWLSLGLRLAAAAVPVVLVVVPMAEGMEFHFVRAECESSHHCEELPPWLKQPWWSNADATCSVKPSWYNRCLEEQPFYLRGWCNFLAGNCYLRDLPQWLVSGALGPLFFCPMVTTLASVLLEIVLCCKSEILELDQDVPLKMKQELEVTSKAKFRFLMIVLLPFLLDVLSDINGIMQFIRTGNLWFAAVSTSIFVFSGWQQVRRGALQRVLRASVESFLHGKASDELELILLSEKSVEAPLQLYLSYYSFPFITSSQFAIYSFFFSMGLSVKSLAEAAYFLVELNLSPTIMAVDGEAMTPRGGVCEEDSSDRSDSSSEG
eukprot:s1251_g15.t1